ncbi:MAG: 30S ribosome-binding factor RbfA [Hyphomicrobiaceae bacterium]|nr:30S ribosome-binding factor RbfA [Hyphomicrobiaceae bacterium]
MSDRKKNHRRDGTGPRKRQLRVGESRRHGLAELLLRVEVDDEVLKDVPLTVSEVRPSPDLRQITVFVAPLGRDNREEIVEALNRHKSYIRGQLSPKVTLKYMPELKFKLDRSFDEYEKISDLLHTPKVAQDLE